MKFADPIYLLIGAVITVVLVALRLWLSRRQHRELTRFAASRLLPRLTKGISHSRRKIKATLFILGVAFLFIALARPQWGSRREEVRMQGIDILIALDTSRSMLASDVSPNRLDRAKLAIHDFTSSLNAARIGLLPFAGEAFLLCPLTLDRSAFESSLADLDTQIIPEGGTDIARAIQESKNIFEKGANQKILILITDGEDLEGGALDAARDAAKNGITIHTVGVGTPAGNLILLDHGRPLTDAQGKAVKSKLDEKTLRELANITGGMYAPLIGNTSGLELIRTERLDKVTKSDLDSQTKEIPIERYHWPLTLAILLLAVEFCLSAAAKNKKTITKATQAAIVSTLLLVAASPLQATPSTNPKVIYNEGVELWKNEKFTEAEQKFHDSLSTTDLTLQNKAYYNIGNTQYRQGQQTQEKEPKKTIQLWEKSIQSYEAAIKLHPNDKEAAYNKNFVQEKLKNLKEQKKEDKKDDEKKEDKQKKEEKKDEQKEKKEEEDKGDQKDQEKEDPSDKKNEDQKKDDQGEEKKEDSKEDGETSDQDQQGDPSKDGQKEEPSKDEKDGKKKDGEKSDSDDDGQKKENKADQDAQPGEAQPIPAQMTKEQAKRLLESLTNEEGKIRFAIPRRTDKKGRPRQPKRDW